MHYLSNFLAPLIMFPKPNNDRSVFRKAGADIIQLLFESLSITVVIIHQASLAENAASAVQVYHL